MSFFHSNLPTVKDWNFDEIVDRQSTSSMKWDFSFLESRFGKGNLLPLWVADMDFKSPTVIRNAIAKRLEHQIYGYSLIAPEYLPAVINWYKRRHQWEIKPEWVLTTPGIVPAIHYIVQRFSKPGDKVIIQTPVYYPFADGIRNNGRQILENPLIIKDGRYCMDFEDLEQKVQDPRVKLAILCSPHNPVGRVWTREELTRFGQICIDHNILVFADEIHCDLIMPGHKHICFASISDIFENNCIVANAASKTFNIAALQQSNVIIPNPNYRQEFLTLIENLGFVNNIGGNLFGAIGVAAGYNEGEPWLEDLIVYLFDNYQYFKERLEGELPGVKVHELEGTYLVWVDFHCFSLPSQEIIRIMEEDAHLALDHGEWFGQNGTKYERFNIACPRQILSQAIDSVVKAFSPYLRDRD